MNQNCSNCRYSTKKGDITDDKGRPIVGHSVYTCTRFPPIPIAVPQAGGVSIRAQFPIVNEQIVCHEWKIRDGLN